MPLHRQLPLAAQNKVARAAAITVELNSRLPSFCHENVGLRELAKIIFEMGFIRSTIKR